LALLERANTLVNKRHAAHLSPPCRLVPTGSSVTTVDFLLCNNERVVKFSLDSMVHVPLTKPQTTAACSSFMATRGARTEGRQLGGRGWECPCLLTAGLSGRSQPPCPSDNIKTPKPGPAAPGPSGRRHCLFPRFLSTFPGGSLFSTPRGGTLPHPDKA